MSRNKAKDQRNHRKRIQTGRSLFEMIMVICIMMLLSIGGYAGYSSAVCGYRTNKAIEEIQDIVSTIRKKHNDNSYYSISTDRIVGSNLLKNGGKNYFGFDMEFSYDVLNEKKPVFLISYPVPRERMCQRILLSKFPDEFQSEIANIVVSPEIDNGMEFEWIGEDYPNSSTVKNVLDACALAKGQTPIILQYSFR
jgi:hypothetical protein